MIASFSYPTSEKKWIQETMKKYPSLRFDMNPFDTFNNQSQFRISGDVLEMNGFVQDRWEHGLKLGFYEAKMAKAKTVSQLEQEGFTFAGLFGLDYSQTLFIINKLLKPHRLHLRRYGNRQEYGDQSFLKIESMDE